MKKPLTDEPDERFSLNTPSRRKDVAQHTVLFRGLRNMLSLEGISMEEPTLGGTWVKWVGAKKKAYINTYYFARKIKEVPLVEVVEKIKNLLLKDGEDMKI